MPGTLTKSVNGSTLLRPRLGDMLLLNNQTYTAAEGVVMTKRFVADDASMLTLHRRLWELARRVIEGSLDVHEVNRALQSLIDGGPNTSAVQLSPAHSRLVQAAAKRFGVRPAEAKRMLGPVPYSAEVLAECAETHVLVPYLGLSLAEVHGLHARLLFDKIAGAWYRKPHHAFAFVKHQPGWYLVQKTVPEGSLNRTWSEQEALVQDGGSSMVIPAAVLVYAAVFHYLKTGEYLFPALYARTSDVSAEVYRVYAGYFGADGLYVGGDQGARRSRIGVAVSRKSG